MRSKYAKFTKKAEVVPILVRQILTNLSFLVTLIFLSSVIFKYIYEKNFSTLKNRIILGIVNGVASIVLLYFGIRFTYYMEFDFSQILLILSVLMGGNVSLIVSGALLFITTIFSHDLDFLVIVLSMEILINIIAFLIINKFPVKTIFKWIIMGSTTIIIKTMFFLPIFKAENDLILAIIFFAIGTLVGCTLVYKLTTYLLTANWTLNYLRELATTDIMTGLLNRTSFELDMKYLKDTYQFKKKISVILIDIDYFKIVNDTYGHPTGDMVLKQLGDIIRNIFHGENVAYRIGGEEFAIILLDTSLSVAIIRAEEIRRQVEKFNFILDDNSKFKVTTSIGIASIPETSASLDCIINDADAALYKAKNEGRNQIYYQVS